MRCITIAVVLALSVTTSLAQVASGEVQGTLSGVVNKYHGEFSDDMFGPGGAVSLQYAPHARIILEPRFGYGTVAWKVNESDLALFPSYFGTNAKMGSLYPGTSTAIRNKNISSFYTVDALFNYVVVQDIPAVVMVTAGAGVIDWSAQTKSSQLLPNGIKGRYHSMAVTLPVGGAVRIPLSQRVGLLLRMEHRFVFSSWLDDINWNGHHDAIVSGSIGLTYRFTPPPPVVEKWSDEHYTPIGADCADLPCDDWRTLCDECCQLQHCVCDDECASCFGNIPCECCTCCCRPTCCACCCCCGCNGSASPAPAAPAKSEGEAEPAPPSQPTPAEPAPSVPAKPAKKFSKDIQFRLDTDEFDLDYPQTEPNLAELLDYMKSAPEGHEVIIEGHASGEGPPQRNKVLSDLRAKKIRSWLIENGVDPKKIRGTVGYGSSMPRVVEPSPDQMKYMTPEEIENIRRQNRRIEIYVQKDGYDKGS